VKTQELENQKDEIEKVNQQWKSSKEETEENVNQQNDETIGENKELKIREI